MSDLDESEKYQNLKAYFCDACRLSSTKISYSYAPCNSCLEVERWLDALWCQHLDGYQLQANEALFVSLFVRVNTLEVGCRFGRGHC